jgi:hypothetical protein
MHLFTSSFLFLIADSGRMAVRWTGLLALFILNAPTALTKDKRNYTKGSFMRNYGWYLINFLITI